MGPVTKFRVLLLKLRRPAKAPAVAVDGVVPAPKQASRFRDKVIMVGPKRTDLEAGARPPCISVPTSSPSLSSQVPPAVPVAVVA